ncbi:MAG: TIGR01777 family oxidoreductase [Candidatus Kapaibacterium sp.]|nr:TIGR01777 family oxidoreductase [Candidatus Kapabacteria bacterium]
MKKIIIVGGTGLIGSNLARMLADEGFEIVILTRNAVKYNSSGRIQYVSSDYRDEKGLSLIINGAYSVINLAGAGIAEKRWTADYKKLIYDSRINSTIALVNAMNNTENPPESFISSSAIGIYGNRGDDVIDENSETADSFLAKVCSDWENESHKIRSEIRLINPRIGVVLSMEGGALPKLSQPFKFFAGGSVGSGKQWVSWIHIYDICRMFLQCINNKSYHGVINFTGPNPVTMKQLAVAIGKTMNRPAFFNVPEFAIKMLLGESAEMVLDSQKVLPKYASENDFEFEFPNIREALDDLFK